MKYVHAAKYVLLKRGEGRGRRRNGTSWYDGAHIKHAVQCVAHHVRAPAQAQNLEFHGQMGSCEGSSSAKQEVHVPSLDLSEAREAAPRSKQGFGIACMQQVATAKPVQGKHWLTCAAPRCSCSPGA
jgi:hypothetical protein